MSIQLGDEDSLAPNFTGMRIDLKDSQSLKLIGPVPLTAHPAGVYLASLNEGSVPTMKHALNAIASLLTAGECDALTLDWSNRFIKTLPVLRKPVAVEGKIKAQLNLCNLEFKVTGRYDRLDYLYESTAKNQRPLQLSLGLD